MEDKVYRNRNFQIACSAGLMAMMMVAIIVPAFPRMVAALGITEQSVGLLITVYTIPSFLLTPLAGIMADRWGRRRLLVPSLFLFGIFGTACAFAPDFKTLLILRVLQGIGGAPLGGITGAIIGDLFSGQKRVEAMGLNTTVMYMGYIIYPLIGGALAGLELSLPTFYHSHTFRVRSPRFFTLSRAETPAKSKKLSRRCSPLPEKLEGTLALHGDSDNLHPSLRSVSNLL